MLINKDTALQEYLDSIYVISHSYSTVSTYRLSIVNQNKVGFRDFIEQKYGFDEIKLVEKIKNQEFDVYKILKENTWFVTNDTDKWSSDMLDLYYPKERKQRLYHFISDRNNEKETDFKLLYRLMKAVHYAYYNIPEMGLRIPEKYVQELKLINESIRADITEFPQDDKMFHTAHEIYEYQAKIKSEKG